jgi:hypothetical protein
MGQGHEVREYPIEASTSDLLFASRSIEGALTGNLATGDAPLKFSVLTGVAAVIETMPLEKAAEACAKMMAGKARLRENHRAPCDDLLCVPRDHNPRGCRSGRAAAVGTRDFALGGVPQAPVGHRQPTPADLPPAVQKEEQPTPLGNPQPQSEPQPPTQSQAQQSKKSRSQSRQASVKGSGAAPPVLQVGPSCEAAGRGAVLLGRSMPCRREPGAQYAEAELVQIRRRRQDPMYRDGVHWRPCEPRRAIVLSRGQQGRARDPKRGSVGGGPQ